MKKPTFAEVDKNAKLANNDFTAIAAAVLEGLGGKENVESLDNCITVCVWKSRTARSSTRRRSRLQAWLA